MRKPIIQLAEGEHHNEMENQNNKQQVQESGARKPLTWTRSEGETSFLFAEGAEIRTADVEVLALLFPLQRGRNAPVYGRMGKLGSVGGAGLRLARRGPSCSSDEWACPSATLSQRGGTKRFGDSSKL